MSGRKWASIGTGVVGACLLIAGLAIGLSAVRITAAESLSTPVSVNCGSALGGARHFHAPSLSQLEAADAGTLDQLVGPLADPTVQAECSTALSAKQPTTWGLLGPGVLLLVIAAVLAATPLLRRIWFGAAQVQVHQSA